VARTRRLLLRAPAPTTEQHWLHHRGRRWSSLTTNCLSPTHSTIIITTTSSNTVQPRIRTCTPPPRRPPRPPPRHRRHHRCRQHRPPRHRSHRSHRGIDNNNNSHHHHNSSSRAAALPLRSTIIIKRGNSMQHEEQGEGASSRCRHKGPCHRPHRRFSVRRWCPACSTRTTRLKHRHTTMPCLPA